jgi:hypothetical protein
MAVLSTLTPSPFPWNEILMIELMQLFILGGHMNKQRDKEILDVNSIINIYRKM